MFVVVQRVKQYWSGWLYSDVQACFPIRLPVDGALPAAPGFLSCCSSLNQAGETESSAQNSVVPLAFLLQAYN